MRKLNNGLFNRLKHISKRLYLYHCAYFDVKSLLIADIRYSIIKNTRFVPSSIKKSKPIQIHRKVMFSNKRIHCKNKRRRFL